MPRLTDSDLMRLLYNNRVFAIACLLIGGAVGFLFQKDPTKIQALQSEIAWLKLELNQAQDSKPLQARRPPTFVSRPIGAPATGEPSIDAAESQAKKQAKAHERELEAWVARRADERNKEYMSVFSQLGVPAEDIERFKSNLVELHRKANAAGDPLGQLALARSAYDHDMRSVLGEENYSRYRTYEITKPAIREYALLEEYAQKEYNVSIEPAYKDLVVGLMRDAGATTTESWDGPYDPLPRPVAGAQAIEQLKDKHTALIERSEILLESLGKSEVPDKYRELIENYYTKKQNDLVTNIAYWSLPFEERRKLRPIPTRPTK